MFGRDAHFCNAGNLVHIVIAVSLRLFIAVTHHGMVVRIGSDLADTSLDVSLNLLGVWWFLGDLAT